MSPKFDIDEARAIRDARTRELAKLKKGNLKLAEVILTPPDALKKADLYLVLSSCDGLGPETIRTICERSKVWPHTRMEKFTKRERLDIVKNLPERVK